MTVCNAQAILVALALFVLICAKSALAETFSFGNDVNGITDQPMATLHGAEFTISLAAGPSGSTLYDVDPQGLGIDSRPVAFSDPDRSKFNLVDGSAPVAGEAIEFSFDRAGVLTGLIFDGVKDETLEYFRLLIPGMTPIYFFDSQADPSAINVPGDVVFLLENGAMDDEVVDLRIPFQAGTAFDLSYGQLLMGNGSRLEGITVVVPEPSGLLLTAFAGLMWIQVRHLGREKLNRYSCSP